jgi:solute carrier family 35 (UDP-xylose/UDP-N-acetylglucosamine transporter), member B4
MAGGGFWVGVALVLTGCVVNNMVMEIMVSPSRNSDADKVAGILLTPVQFLFTILGGLPEYIASKSTWQQIFVPAMPWKDLWMLVLLHAPMSHLNNLAFAFGKVNQVMHVVVRSAGAVVSLLLGVLFFRQRFSWQQVGSVALLTVGAVLIAVAERKVPPPCCGEANTAPATFQSMTIVGEAVLVLILIVAALLTHLQSHTRKKYPQSSSTEQMVWIHCLGLVVLLVLGADVTPSSWRAGEEGIVAKAARWSQSAGTATLFGAQGIVLPSWLDRVPSMWTLVLLNGITQIICIRGVFLLIETSSPLVVTLVLTVRKIATLCMSVALFGHAFTSMHLLASLLVFGGTFAYSLSPSVAPAEQDRPLDEESPTEQDSPAPELPDGLRRRPVRSSSRSRHSS